MSLNDDWKAGENDAWNGLTAWLWGLALFLALTILPALIDAL